MLQKHTECKNAFTDSKTSILTRETRKIMAGQEVQDLKDPLSPQMHNIIRAVPARTVIRITLNHKKSK